MQQLRALPVDSYPSPERVASAAASTPAPSPGVVRAQATARAQANQISSQYRAPAQPKGRVTVQHNHPSPWLEGLTQVDRVQVKQNPSLPMNTTDHTPLRARLVSAGSELSPKSQSGPARARSLSPELTADVHIELDLPDDLRSSLSSMEATPSKRDQSQNTRPESTPAKPPTRYFPKQPQPNPTPLAERDRNPLTSKSLPRVSRVPLPQQTSKELTSSTQQPLESITQPDGNMLPNSAPSVLATSESDTSAPKRIPAISTSIAPVPGTMRISSAILQSTVGDGMGEGVRVPAELSDATRAERDSAPPARPGDTPLGTSKDNTALSLPTTSVLPTIPKSPVEATPESPRDTSPGTSQRSPALNLPATPTLPAIPKLPVGVAPNATPTAPTMALDGPPSHSKRAIPLSQTPSDQRLRMEAPHLQVLLNGPPHFSVGSPAKYEVVVHNHDAIELHGLILRLDIPAGIQVQTLHPTHGQFDVEQAADSMTMLTWEFEHLAAGQTATAPLQLVASTGRNFAIAMEWTLMPIASTSSLEARAPRLELALEGSESVQFGQPNVYRLHVRNPGNAPAKAVTVRLCAEPYGSSAAEIAHIAPGEEEVIDVELTFNERGVIEIVAQAQELSGQTSQTAISVLVRQAVVQSQLSATDSVYFGGSADYRVRLSNAGDADADNLQARLQLPDGASLISAPSGAALVGLELTWPVDKLSAGGSEEFQVSLKLTKAGENLAQFSCSGLGQVGTSAQATTRVEAITDLKLTVDDPDAPAPVGDEVVYELNLTNRGAKEATNVKVVAMFSEGIEPVRSEGQAARVVPGQALFEPITRIGAGESVRLKVIAQAAAAGTHRFRVEVRSDDSEVRLVQEESTRFMQAASGMASGPQASILR